MRRFYRVWFVMTREIIHVVLNGQGHDHERLEPLDGDGSMMLFESSDR